MIVGQTRPVVLVVDDEPAILDALEDLLEDDFHVLKATSGGAGLELLTAHTVSVVLSDQKMPGMKGEEFLAKVAESHVTTRVLLTGYTDFDDLVRAVNRGHIYAFVSKPWSPHQLRSLVRAAAERFNLERELLHEKTLLNLLLENIPDLISIKDNRKRYLRLNAACAKALGSADPANLVGKTDQELGGPLFEDASAREQAILEGGEPDTDRTELLLRAARWYSTTRVATSTTDGPEVLIGISRDITERLESSQRLEEHATQLERMNRELARFSFIVAHHLQEPLRSIRSFTDLLVRRSLLRDGAEDYVSYISDSVNRAKSLMRDFSIYLNLHEAAEREPVSLGAAAREAIASLSAEQQKASIILAGEATLEGHRALVTQLFRALLDNAVVHGDPDNEVKVSIEPYRDGARVRIEDSGPGIPKEAHDRVFHLFETLDGGPRSGLGLALCQKIVELHGGEIGLENRAGGGLRVTFTLLSLAGDHGRPPQHSPSPSSPLRPATPARLTETASESQLKERLARLESFSSTAAHDLREPLRMVKSYLNLLRRREGEALSENGREYLDYSLNSANRMSALLEACLAYARSGRPADGEKTPIAQTLKDVIADLQVAIDETRATIEVSELPDLRLHAVEAYQVLSNLLGNALKYRGERPPIIRITAEHGSYGTRVSVTDNGIGVPAEKRDTIFEPFVRGDHETAIRGAGLGLATVRRIVEGWGGTLGCEPIAEGGSRFWLIVPA